MQGRHNECVLIVIDEAIGVDEQFFVACESMLNGVEVGYLLLYNPTDGTSHVRRTEESGTGKVVRLNALEHPNIIAERQGLPAPFPAAVRLDFVENFVKIHGEPIQHGSEDVTRDIEIGWRILPDGSRTQGQWYRPTGEVEARILGRWPSQSEQAVWSEWAWRNVTTKPINPNGRVQIGVDVALDGPDKVAFAVRQGGVLRFVQSFQGWHPSQTHRYARELAWEWGQKTGCNPKAIPIVVDEIGCGSAVTCQPPEGYQFVPLNVAEKAMDEYSYPNKRSELAFALADAARDGNVYFDVSDGMKKELQAQFLSMRYKAMGTRRVVQPKPDQKKLLGKSPDEADAVTLSFANVCEWGTEKIAGRIGV